MPFQHNRHNMDAQTILTQNYAQGSPQFIPLVSFLVTTSLDSLYILMQDTTLNILCTQHIYTKQEGKALVLL